jgi:hypothetical protein
MSISHALQTVVYSARNLIDRSSRRRRLILGVLALASVALSPTDYAVEPPPDGGYPNFNTAEGDSALFSLTTGVSNTAIGFAALYFNNSGSFNTACGVAALQSNTTGIENTATGFQTLFSNTSGGANTAIGYEVLFDNTTGASNTAIGFAALLGNTSGNDNTATGVDALSSNTVGHDNTANGVKALFQNSSGEENAATGVNALSRNTSGSGNTASGFQALLGNRTGSANTAEGMDALSSNTTGAANTACGVEALLGNTTGNDNTADGVAALVNNTIGGFNTAIGFQALFHSKSGSNNIALGNSAGLNLTNGSNNIEIGAPGVAGEANTIRIGKSGTQKKTFIAGIRGVTVASGVGVIVGTSGQVGAVVSSARFKEAIKPMDNASEAILALKPVTFRYKEELDPDGIPQFGLIAEDVEKVNPDLVARDEDGQISTVRYEAVNAMLLNEFLKEHHKVEQQQAIIDHQQEQIDALAATMQRLSAQIESSNSLLPAVVVNQ